MEDNSTIRTGVDRKRARDATRKRGGHIQKKRLHVLNNPAKLGFKGWWNAPQPWQSSTCEEFIEWCHISKQFPHERHRFHRHAEKANLTFCENVDFVERCIEVYQHLYNTAFVKRNEVSLLICRMVYAEVVLERVVDWTTIKSSPNITVPSEPLIPRERRFPNGGLKRAIRPSANVAEKEYITDTSEADSDSDGARIPRPLRGHRVLRAAVNVAAEHVLQDMHPSENIGLIEAPMEIVGDPVEAGIEVVGVPVEAVEMVGVPLARPMDQTKDVADLRVELSEKDDIIAQLQRTIQNLHLELSTKDSVISELQNELQQRRPVEHVEAPERVAVQDPMEVDETYINNLVDVVTAGVLEDIRTPPRRQRKPVMLPPFGPLARPYVDIDGPLSQDSLSFPTVEPKC